MDDGRSMRAVGAQTGDPSVKRGLRENYCATLDFDGSHERHDRGALPRMLKKPDLLTRPTPARRDPPFRGQGRSEQPTMALPSLLVYVAQDGSDEFPDARVQRGPSQAARCASTGDSPGHPPLLAGFFSTL